MSFQAAVCTSRFIKAILFCSIYVSNFLYKIIIVSRKLKSKSYKLECIICSYSVKHKYGKIIFDDAYNFSTNRMDLAEHNLLIGNMK